MKVFIFLVSGVQRIRIPANDKQEAIKKLQEEITDDVTFFLDYTLEDNSWISEKVERSLEE